LSDFHKSTPFFPDKQMYTLLGIQGNSVINTK